MPEPLQARPATPQAVRPASAPRSLTQGSRAVVVGLARDIPRALEHPAALREFDIVGIVTVAEDDAQLREHSESLHHLLRDHRARIVLVAGPLGNHMMRAVSDLALLHGCRLLAVMPSEVVSGQKPAIVWEGAAPLVQLAANTTSRLQWALKRLVDVVVASVALTLLAPLMAAVALAIRLESRGPALFRHWRVGQRGKQFPCLKFRTMQIDAERRLRQDPALWASYREHGFRIPDDEDPRVTGLGRLLRRTSLDELPQLINVLVGEMSLIGPRPIVQEELEHYVGSERLLLSVRPGITGLWAVSGRHRLAYPERAAVELGYVRQWSLARDIDIALRTVRAVADYGSSAPRA